MTDILIRDLDPTTEARLKQSAKKHGRSLQAHLKLLFEEVAPFTMAEAAAASGAWHQRLKGRRFIDASVAAKWI